MDSGTNSSTTSSSQASPAATFVPLLDVASLSSFNPKEDPNTLTVFWKLRKHLFNLYLVAKGVTKDEQKSALPLHTGSLRAYQLSENSATGQQDYHTFAVGVGQPKSGSEVDLRIRGVMLHAVLIDSGVSCNVIDQTTWEVLKKKSVQCESKKSSKKLFAYGQKDPIEVIGTFVPEIVCEISGNSCVDEFTVVKGPGRPLLGKNTAEKLGTLRVGPDVCSLTVEGSDADIREKYIEVFTGGQEAEGFPAEITYKRRCQTCHTTHTETAIWVKSQG